MGSSSYEGRCHCGAIRFAFTTSKPPLSWSLRRCECSFCRAQGALYTSDPAGQVRFVFRNPAEVVRYTFGTRTADFVFCGICGVYLGAVAGQPGARLAVLNVNTMNLLDLPGETPHVSFDGETAEDREARRLGTWTPMVEND